MGNQPTNRKTLKRIRFIFIAAVASSCLLAGCKGKYKEDPVAEPAILQTSFVSADAATKGTVDTIVSNITAMYYQDALADLQKVYSISVLTPAQTNAVLGVKSFVMNKIAEAAKSSMPK
jgi:hypothetical protein